MTEICEWSLSTNERRLEVAGIARTRLAALKSLRGDD
jgi:predicted Fe-S protein YdhL (DUF1289 family)